MHCHATLRLPPFETSNINSTYQRIQKNLYRMSSRGMSEPARADPVGVGCQPRDRPTDKQILTREILSG
jgi:hypothetical protein